MKTCETCKHWIEPNKHGWADCRQMANSETVDICTYGYSDETDHGAWLRTSKEFGCILHEAKDA